MRYARSVKSSGHLNADADPARAGLCANCVHTRRIESSRGSTFLLCQLSATDPRFPKYPALPVIRCSGHTTANKSGD